MKNHLLSYNFRLLQHFSLDSFYWSLNGGDDECTMNFDQMQFSVYIKFRYRFQMHQHNQLIAVISNIM